MPELTKFQAYTAFLGFNITVARQLGLQPPEIVGLANEFAYAMGYEEIPEVEAKMVGKMGLKGVPGLRIMGKGGVSRAAPVPSGRTGGGRAQGGPGRMQRGKVADPRPQGVSGGNNGSRADGNRRGPRESTGANAEEPSRKRPRRGAQA